MYPLLWMTMAEFYGYQWRIQRLVDMEDLCVYMERNQLSLGSSQSVLAVSPLKSSWCWSLIRQTELHSFSSSPDQSYKHMVFEWFCFQLCLLPVGFLELVNHCCNSYCLALCVRPWSGKHSLRSKGVQAWPGLVVWEQLWLYGETHAWRKDKPTMEQSILAWQSPAALHWLPGTWDKCVNFSCPLSIQGLCY